MLVRKFELKLLPIGLMVISCCPLPTPVVFVSEIKIGIDKFVPATTVVEKEGTPPTVKGGLTSGAVFG